MKMLAFPREIPKMRWETSYLVQFVNKTLGGVGCVCVFIWQLLLITNVKAAQMHCLCWSLLAVVAFQSKWSSISQFFSPNDQVLVSPNNSCGSTSALSFSSQPVTSCRSGSKRRGTLWPLMTSLGTWRASRPNSDDTPWVASVCSTCSVTKWYCTLLYLQCILPD